MDDNTINQTEMNTATLDIITTTSKVANVTILPFIPRTDILPLDPADGEIWYLNSTNNIKIYIAGIGWGTIPVMFLPDITQTE